jgi:hypothetical protein
MILRDVEARRRKAMEVSLMSSSAFLPLRAYFFALKCN